MISIPVKRRRRPYPVWRPYVSSMNRECGHGEFCSECIANFAAEAEHERPGHVWTVYEGKVVFMEDKIAESMLGRSLSADEVVIHKDGNVLNNERANLEIVTLPDLESK